ncbi:MAG: hypothetical protein QGI74_08960 [Phycisphaerales bacterium]|nr:hypothetical protein [Phycisphaerales bacterium]
MFSKTRLSTIGLPTQLVVADRPCLTVLAAALVVSHPSRRQIPATSVVREWRWAVCVFTWRIATNPSLSGQRRCLLVAAWRAAVGVPDLGRPVTGVRPPAWSSFPAFAGFLLRQSAAAAAAAADLAAAAAAAAAAAMLCSFLASG